MIILICNWLWRTWNVQQPVKLDLHDLLIARLSIDNEHFQNSVDGDTRREHWIAKTCIAIVRGKERKGILQKVWEPPLRKGQEPEVKVK